MKWYFYPVEKTENKIISTSATYTENKNFISTQSDQHGNVTSYRYDQTKGTLMSTTDPKGNTTTYTYDANTNALTSVSSGDMTNSYSYEDDLLTEINVNGSTRYQFVYDKFGRKVETNVGNGLTYRNLSKLIYNSNGLLQKEEYGNGDYTTFSYDNLDRLLGKSYNDSSIDKVEYFYGADGNLSKTIDYSTNTRTKFVYDLAGRLMSSRDYRNGYSDNNGLIGFLEYSYADKTNYLTGIKHYNALGTQNIGYRYGNLANGEMPDQIYGITWNGQQTLDYTYDGLGRLTNKSLHLYGNDPYDEFFDTNYTYVDVAGSNNKTTSLIKSISTEGITHNYEYDELGNIISIYDGSKYNTYEYDELNQLVRENLGYENVTYTYEYVNGNITYKHKYAYTTGELPSTPLSSVRYHYDTTVCSDVLLKISRISYSGTSTASTYSLKNNTETATTNPFAQSLFGNNYNAVDLTQNSIVNVGKDNLGNSSDISTYAVSSSSETAYTLQVDEIGNLSKVNGVDLNWNGRRLESISEDGTEIISYDYNMDGQRVKKTVNGVTTEYFYNSSILAGQKTGDDVIIFMYDNDGDVFGFTYNGTPYYYVKNAQNDVYLIIDENGYAQVLYQYDAWGKVTFCVDATDFGLAGKNPIMYRSYYVDLETGLFMYYLNSRYYVADWGRFISADDVAVLEEDQDSMIEENLFTYCLNNPVNLADDDGTVAWWIAAAAAGAAWDAAFYCVEAAITGNFSWKQLGKTALKGAVTGLAFGAVGKIAGKAVKAVKVAKSAKKASKAKKSSKLCNVLTKITKKNFCFVAGTEVLTSEGLVPIEEIKVGDLVWAENPETGEKELKPVVQLFVSETNELVHLVIDNDDIFVTPEHPFYVLDKGWVNTIELEPGDKIPQQDGDISTIYSIFCAQTQTPVTVYNFEVADFHTYYVGEDSVLVHNMCQRIKNITKQQSSVWKSFKNAGNGLKKSGVGRKTKYYSWDNLHNEIEVFNNYGKHLGAMDPSTGKMIKAAVKGRKLW